MYGIFLEEINHGVDGGLYAEQVRNRGFEDAKPPEGFTYKDDHWVSSAGYDAGFDRFGYFTNGLPFWTLVQDGGSRGSMNLDLSHPLNPATPRLDRCVLGLRKSVRASALPTRVFRHWRTRWPEKYHLSFWARGGTGFSGPISVSLKSAEGHALSQPVSVTGITTEWKKFGATLTADETDDHCCAPPGIDPCSSRARFGSIWISLLPAGNLSLPSQRTAIGHRANDRRFASGICTFSPAVASSKAARIETSYNWRKTIGPLEHREEVWGPWNYRRTHGMGFYEYLQFCNDINAAALFVGLCRRNLPLPQRCRTRP